MKKIISPRKNSSLYIAGALSILAGLSVFWALYQIYLPINVIIPVKDINAGKILEKNDLGQMTISRRDMPSDSITGENDAVGKYCRDNLYYREPILKRKLGNNPNDYKQSAPENIAIDETYLSFEPNEAKWPRGLKVGGFVTVMGISDFKSEVLAEHVRILEIADGQMLGQIDSLKKAVGVSKEGITLLLKWHQIEALLGSIGKYKELWILPEHPNRQ
ncbi:MAG: hypothetical protein HGA27_05530 [Peptococcaceae bacterium]|nr:hypothetical protein [Peptococcaceae bacterium]